MLGRQPVGPVAGSVSTMPRDHGPQPLAPLPAPGGRPQASSALVAGPARRPRTGRPVPDVDHEVRIPPVTTRTPPANASTRPRPGPWRRFRVPGPACFLSSFLPPARRLAVRTLRRAGPRASGRVQPRTAMGRYHARWPGRARRRMRPPGSASGPQLGEDVRQGRATVLGLRTSDAAISGWRAGGDQRHTSASRLVTPGSATCPAGPHPPGVQVAPRRRNPTGRVQL